MEHKLNWTREDKQQAVEIDYRKGRINSEAIAWCIFFSVVTFFSVVLISII